MQNAPGIVEIAEENETFKSGALFSLRDSRLGYLRLENSGSAVQTFVEAHYLVSESSGHLQDCGNATERGQVQHVSVRRRRLVPSFQEHDRSRHRTLGILLKLVVISPV